MKKYIRNGVGAFVLLASASWVAGQSVHINEIMYHPPSEDVREEFVELYNAGPTNVNVGGWRLDRGVTFTIPTNTTISSGGFLIIAADTAAFSALYPGAGPVVGNWVGVLSNTRNTIELEDANGDRVDLVEYAEEGDWAIRARGPVLSGHRGWIWYKEHDGLGKSLELVNPAMPNELGVNWASSLTFGGTPGEANSVLTANSSPLITDVTHVPALPTSTDNIRVLARVRDEQLQNVTVELRWRLDGVSSSFSTLAMFDDGLHGDGAAGDGVFGGTLGTLADNSIVDFYVETRDGQDQVRTWPAAAMQTDGSFAQTANALFQVSDTAYTGEAPLYRLVMTSEEYDQLGQIFCCAPGSDAQMNATFISEEGTGLSVRYLVGVRNRGHGSRSGNPHNYRVNFRADDLFMESEGLNLNARNPHIQHLAAILAQKAGLAGADSRAVQLRVNGGQGPGGTPGDGHYAANEVMGPYWARRHFPQDSGGNVYKVIRDIDPPNFNYRGTDPGAYMNTYFKQSNLSENDWSDLIGMLQVMGENSGTALTEESAVLVAHVDQWMRHMALMAIFANNESGLFTGNNDDYYWYSGAIDRRFLMCYHDLDSVLGSGFGATTSILTNPTCCPASGDSEGMWRAMARYLTNPGVFAGHYYAALQDMIDTTFSQEQFDPLVDQTLGFYVSNNTRDNIKNWMSQRRASIQGQINGLVPPAPSFATLSGEPRSPTWLTSATLLVGTNDNIVAYRYKFNSASYGQEIPVNQAIILNNLPAGSTNTVYVLAKNSAGIWQSDTTPTISRTWTVDPTVSPLVISEVLARNDGAVIHEGTQPDYIELFNEFISTIDVGGLRLTDDPGQPDKYVIPAGTMIGPRGYLVLYANNPDGTSGMHTGFSLDQGGEALYLFASEAQGGGLMDSVMFGQQLPNLSIARPTLKGAWLVSQPTPGAANVAAMVGDPRTLVINEWQAASQPPFPDDFIELHNPGALPINAAGLYLTDEPIGDPRQAPIGNATLVPPGGYLALIADGNGTRPNHLDMQLASESGKIALLDGVKRAIDYVNYGPQVSGQSMGRCPDSGDEIRVQGFPTPGVANACPEGPVDPETINLLPLTHVWKYSDTGTDLGTAWREPGYDDSAWPSGAGMLGAPRSGGTLPETLNTPLATANGKSAFYFRTTFNYDTNNPAASLTLSHIIDDGCVIYVNGNEILRYNMPGGTITYSTLSVTFTLDPAWIGPIDIPFDTFQPGVNVVAVETHNNSSTQSPDMIMGLRVDGVLAGNNPSLSGILINEVLASNATRSEVDGTTPDRAELYNPSTTAVDLGGLRLANGLSGDVDEWTFPMGTVITGHGFRTIRFDASFPPGADNTGFNLPATGGSVYLLNTVANGSAVLDVIHYGIQVPDFALGRMPDGGVNWTLTLPSQGQPNIAAVLGDPGMIRINEWMAAPDSGDDWFELYNAASLPVAIGGLFLTDDLTEVDKSMIPAHSYLGGITNAWQKFVADGNLQAGADHVDFSLGASGESIGLYRPDGSQIDAVSFGPQVSGVSEGRLPDGTANLVSFPGTESPGDINYTPLTTVVVNEVLAHSDPPLEDAIEIRNLQAGPVDLGGWWLSDAKSSPYKYQIPPGTTLPGNGYLVFYENQFNNSDVASAPFSLSSASGDQVHLSAAPAGLPNGLRHSVSFGPSANAISLGRHATSVGVDFVPLLSRTFGADTPAWVAQFRTGTGLPNAGPVIGPMVFTEIMYHPPAINSNDNVLLEFVELHNLSQNSVPLYDTAFPTNTWRLRAGIDFEFPQGTVIPPGGFIIVVSFDPVGDPASRAAFELAYDGSFTLHGPYRNKLDNGGEAIELQRPDTPQMPPSPDAGLVPYITVERIEYGDAAPWPVGGDGDGLSLQRTDPALYGNDPAHWIAATPSPAPGTSGQLDTDGDLMPDSYENANGLDAFRNDANEDLDEDGMTNLEEYQSGTDPQDENNLLRIDAEHREGGGVTLRFTAQAGRSYSVLYKATLETAFWSNLTNLTALPTPAEQSVADPGGGMNTQRFYKVVTPAQP